ncbi:hypothetical protein LTR09_012584 [Extremus antarcticus]|uniref:Uncharacterized protein n=1 Tax=Extremus antarcticus TaxID=702011 RepID=A0AAJ0D9T9_9PEZI|nr:hypothetical protein LTR09_012584 [Extremus antarcticus]
MADSGLDIVARWLENNRQADDFLGQTDISQPPPIATQGDNFDIPFRFDAEAWDWPQLQRVEQLEANVREMKVEHAKMSTMIRDLLLMENNLPPLQKHSGFVLRKRRPTS